MPDFNSLDEIVTRDTTVTIVMPYQIYKLLYKLIIEGEDLTNYQYKLLKEYVGESIENYDGIPIEFLSNVKKVISNKTGNIISLT